jgi:hypothetical protein
MINIFLKFYFPEPIANTNFVSFNFRYNVAHFSQGLMKAEHAKIIVHLFTLKCLAA